MDMKKLIVPIMTMIIVLLSLLYYYDATQSEYQIDDTGNLYAVRTPPIDGGSTGFGTQNRTNNLKNLTDNWYRYNNVSFLANLRDGRTVVAVPWFKRGDACLMNTDATNGFRICNNAGTTGFFTSGNHSNQTFCQVTDEGSQVALADALGSQNNTRMDAWVNTISALNCGLASNLTEWTTGFWYNASGGHWVVDCGQVSDTASDADAHFITALAVINTSPYANSTTRTKAGNLLDSMCQGFASENFYEWNVKNRVNQHMTSKYLDCGGTNVCTSPGANSVTWLGYKGPILEALAACHKKIGDGVAAKGGWNYTRMADDTFQNHLMASNWTGNTFTIGMGRQYHWANYSGGAMAYAVCDGNCIYMDDPDGMRAPRMCNGAAIWKDLIGYELTNATTYCQQWHNLVGETGTAHTLERWFDGSARSSTTDGGYKAMGIGAFMNALVNTSLADDRINRYNTHIGVVSGTNRLTMDSQACFGVYDKAFGIMSLGFLIGNADEAFITSATSGDPNITITGEFLNDTDLLVGESVRATVSVSTTNGVIRTVIFSVNYPNGTVHNLTAGNASQTLWNATFANTVVDGTYTVTPIFANSSTTEKLSQASSLSFTVSNATPANQGSNVTVANITINTTVIVVGDHVLVRGNVSTSYGSLTSLLIEILYPNGVRLNHTGTFVQAGGYSNGSLNSTTGSGSGGNDSNLIANDTFEVVDHGWTGYGSRLSDGDTYINITSSATGVSRNLSLLNWGGAKRNYTINVTISSCISNYTKIFFASQASSTVGPRVMYEYDSTSGSNTLYRVKHEGGAYCVAATFNTCEKHVLQIFADNTNNQTTFKVFNATSGAQIGSTCSANSYITNPSSSADYIRVQGGTQAGGGAGYVKLYNFLVMNGTGLAGDGSSGSSGYNASKVDSAGFDKNLTNEIGDVTYNSTDKAWNFGGTNGIVSLPNLQTFNINPGATTFSIWYNTRDSTPEFIGSNFSTTNRFIRMNTDGAIRVEGDTNNNNCGADYGSTVLNSWQHWLVIVDGGTCTFYHNGTLVTPTDSNIADNISMNSLGYAGDASALYMNGSMKDIRIFNRSLTSTEALALYQGYDAACENLDRHYYMDENNIKACNSTGSITNGTAFSYNHTNTSLVGTYNVTAVYAGTSGGDINYTTTLLNFTASSDTDAPIVVVQPENVTINHNTTYAILVNYSVSNMSACVIVPESRKLNNSVFTGSFYRNNGQYIGNAVNTTRGKYGYGTTFDGVDDAINASRNDTQHNINNQITLMAWVNVSRLPSEAGATYHVISKEASSAGYALWIWSSDDTPRCTLNGLSDPFPTGSSAGVSVGTWAHIACVYNGTHVNTYYNGTIQLSDDTAGVISNSSVKLRVGLRPDGQEDYNGTIDAVRVWSFGMNAEQIALEMNNERPYNGSGLVVSYEMDWYNASTVYDTRVDANLTIAFHDNATGRVGFGPNISITNRYSFKMNATDSCGNVVDAVWLWNITNTPPVCTALANVTAAAGSNLNRTVICTDADGDTLTYYDNTTDFNINSAGFLNYTTGASTVHYLIGANDSINVSQFVWVVTLGTTGNATTVGFCDGMPKIQLVPNLSAEYRNETTKLTTQSRLANGTINCAIRVNATAEPSAVLFEAKLNASHSNYTVQLGNVNLTTSYQTIDTVSAGGVGRYNLTGYWKNASYNFYPFRITVRIT